MCDLPVCQLGHGTSTGPQCPGVGDWKIRGNAYACRYCAEVMNPADSKAQSTQEDRNQEPKLRVWDIEVPNPLPWPREKAARKKAAGAWKEWPFKLRFYFRSHGSVIGNQRPFPLVVYMHCPFKGHLRIISSLLSYGEVCVSSGIFADRLSSLNGPPLRLGPGGIDEYSS